MTHHNTILLADDDVEGRQAAAELLRRQDYRVIQAATCGQVQEMLGDQDRAVAVLVTELSFSDGGGLELAEWVQATRPEIGVIIFTAAAEDARSEIGSRGTPLVVAKPCGDELLAAITAALPTIGFAAVP